MSNVSSSSPSDEETSRTEEMTPASPHHIKSDSLSTSSDADLSAPQAESSPPRRTITLELDDAFSAGDVEEEDLTPFQFTIAPIRKEDDLDDHHVNSKDDGGQEIEIHRRSSSEEGRAKTPVSASARVASPLPPIEIPEPDNPPPGLNGNSTSESELPSEFENVELSPTVTRRNSISDLPRSSASAYATSAAPSSSSVPLPKISTTNAIATDSAPHSHSRKPSSTSSILYSTPVSIHVPPPPSPTFTSAHRPSQKRPHAGPSMLESVLSKTRPKYLPPKSKEEDEKHLRDWQEMMKQSRVAGEQRALALEQRRLSRESEVDAVSTIWEGQILPDWRAAVRNPQYRKLWWSGIPSKLRGRAWQAAIGNGLALSKDSYRTCIARARRAIASRSFPVESMRLMELDILDTVPNLRLFHPVHGAMYGELKDLLCAWTVARSDEGLGYVRGAAAIGAMLLMNMAVEQAFVAMRNLLERHLFRSFYGGLGTKEDTDAYCRIFDTLLADWMPKVYFNFKQHQVSPVQYLPEWLLPIFLHHLPFEVCSRIWDVIVLEGDSFLFRAALAMLSVMESRLFFPDRQELVEVLRGENKAALEVAKRTGIAVDLSARYEQYGMSEEALWERLGAMDDWWKDSTWTRLIQRELPDL